MKGFLVACLTLVLTGCASYPDNVAVAEGTELTNFTDVNNSNSNVIGQTVRWSGVIAKISNEKTLTKLDVLYYPASKNGRPITKDEPLGRFRVVINGFVDPAVYRQGKAVTALGNLKEPETDRIGEYEYEYPTLTSKNIHLWEAVVIKPQVQLNYGWYGTSPRWYWRDGVRRVYINEKNRTRPARHAAPKSSNKQ